MIGKREQMQACINEYGGEYGKVVRVFDTVKTFKVENVEGRFGIVSEDPDTLYIVFRGSDGKKDWLDNIRFWKKEVRKSTPYKDVNKKIKVHNRFMWQYKQVRKIIHDEIKERKPNKIIVLGHSLGGALTTLCSLDIEFNFNMIYVSAVTFGSPRVGNRHFKKSYNKRVPDSIRVVNGKDIVTKVPFGWMGFHHVAVLHKIGKRSWYKLFSVTDHYPQEYYKNNK